MTSSTTTGARTPGTPPSDPPLYLTRMEFASRGMPHMHALPGMHVRPGANDAVASTGARTPESGDLKRIKVQPRGAPHTAPCLPKDAE